VHCKEEGTAPNPEFEMEVRSLITLQFGVKEATPDKLTFVNDSVEGATLEHAHFSSIGANICRLCQGDPSGNTSCSFQIQNPQRRGYQQP
jgi:hypothetical protein